MGRIWMPGGAGGADLDVITAGEGDILSGKVIVGPDGEPLTGTLALTGSAADSQVLAGKTYYNTDAKARRTGTMPNQGAVAPSGLNAGGSYTIPAGYHNGSGKVTANSLASQTGVQSGKTAAGAGQVLTGYEAWVNGGRVTGTMPNQGAKTAGVNCGGTYTIPAGYHNGQGEVTGNSLASQTDATSGAGDILSGKTAWVKGSKLTGTMANKGAVTGSVSCGGSYTIPAGYHNGSGKITGNSLASQTGVQSGKTAAGAGQVLTGYEAWVNGGRVTGTMANQGAKTSSLNCGGSYTIPAGYHNGSGKVTANSLASQTSADAGAGHILSGKTAWVNGSKVTGTMANVASIDTAKSVGWDNDYGYIRMTNGAHITNASSGYPEVKVPYQNFTVTPSASQQSISARGLSGKLIGNVTVNAVNGLAVGNIKRGVTICGVTGDVDRFTQYTGTTVSSLTTKTFTDINGNKINHYWVRIEVSSWFRPMSVAVWSGGEVSNVVTQDPWNLIEVKCDTNEAWWFSYDADNGVKWDTGTGEIILPVYKKQTRYDYVINGYNNH